MEATGINKLSTVETNLRDLRKAPAGKHSIIKRYRGKGVYEYCIIPDTKGRHKSKLIRNFKPSDYFDYQPYS